MSQCNLGCSTESIHIDINTTSICNIACTYCSEGNECGLSTLYLKNTQVKVEDLINKIGKDPSKHKTINFWGGEPFVNWNYCKLIIDEFKEDPNYSFFFYTNGILIPDKIDELKSLNESFGKEIGKDGNPRLVIQISYDGEWLTDNIRVDKSGKGTAQRVKKAFNLLKENGIETSLKSVISSDGFEHLYDSYVDILNLQGYYNPTPDLWSERTPEEYSKDLEVLSKQLEKIIAYMIKNNIHPDSFSWFSKSRAICSVGSNMISVDLDGKLYPCHAGMYGEKPAHVLGTLDNFTEVKEKSMKIFKKINSNLPLDCQNCDVNFCMKCQMANFTKSKKEDYADKFTDYQANWQVCKLFKMNDKYNKVARFEYFKNNPKEGK